MRLFVASRIWLDIGHSTLCFIIPDLIDKDCLKEINSSLSRILSIRSTHVQVGVDFNYGDIESYATNKGVQLNSLSNNL